MSKTLSPRAKRALDILRNGGKFIKSLEKDFYTNRSHFHHRLYDAYGNLCRGYSSTVFSELENYMVITLDSKTSSEYRIKIEFL